MDKRKQNDNFLRKKQNKNKTVLSEWDLWMEKRQFFQWSWNYKGNCLNKDVKKTILKKI